VREEGAISPATPPQVPRQTGFTQAGEAGGSRRYRGHEA